MRGRVDYSGTLEMSQNLQNVIDMLPVWLLDYLNKKGQQFIERIMLRTPVDTGRLQRSWRMESIRWRGKTLEAVFINDANDGRASYASFVEYGHAKPYRAGAAPGSEDWVMGAFMLTYTIQEIEQELPAELTREFRALLKTFNLG